MGEMCYSVTAISKKNKPLIKENEDFKKRRNARIEEKDGRVIFQYSWNEWDAPPWDLDAEIDDENHIFIAHDYDSDKDVKIPFRDASGGWLSVYVFTGKRNIEFMATKTDLDWTLEGLIIENIKQIEIQEWYG